MKSAKEFLERLNSDPDFAKEFSQKMLEKKEAGAKDQYDAIIPIAAELGYEITADQIKKVNEAATEELSEEELGKVAGGTSCYTLYAISSVVITMITLVNTIEEIF